MHASHRDLENDMIPPIGKRQITALGRLSSCLALLQLAACLSKASPGLVTDAVYAAYDTREFSSGPVSTAVAGAKLGYEVRRDGSHLRGIVEAGYLAADAEGLGIVSVGAGGKIAALSRARVELGFLTLIEYQHLSLDRFRNSNHLLAFGLGAYAQVRILPRVSLALTLSAHAFGDATPPTTCNDGSSSQSTGSGTCSHHGGIAFYNDKLGAGGGVDALVGVSIWFGQASRQPRTAAPSTTAQEPSRPTEPILAEIAVESSLESVHAEAFLDDSKWVLKVENKTDDPVVVYWTESTLEVDGVTVGRLKLGDEDASDPIPSLGELRVHIDSSEYDVDRLTTARSAKVHLVIKAVVSADGAD